MTKEKVKVVEVEGIPLRDAQPLYLPYFWKLFACCDDEEDEVVLIKVKDTI